MANLTDLLNDLYPDSGPSSRASMEKTAAEQLEEALTSSDILEDDSFAGMSTQDLANLALELESRVAAESSGDPEILQKVAMDTLGGKIMAHSVVHELDLIKTAVANGVCRVCKQNPFDIEGSTICSTCSEA